jgi:ribosome-associated protein
LEQLSVLESPSKGITRLTRNSKIFKTIIKSIQDKKGSNIVSLDLKNIPEAVADFFIICQAASTTQVRAIADFIEDEVREYCDERPYKNEGKQTSQWVLVDYISIVVHIMHPEAHQFYRLEDMWSDAPLQKHES